MLKQRILTAIVLVTLIVWSILALPSDYFSLVLGVFVMAAGWEWTRLVNIKSTVLRLFFIALLIASAITLEYLARKNALVDLYVLAMAVLWWLVCGYVIVKNIKVFVLSTRRLLPGIISGLLLLLPPWYALSLLHASGDHGPAYVMFVFILIALADTGAYFSGRRWGRRKLAPDISPGKTWEGIWGASATIVLFAFAGGYFMLGMGTAELLPFVLLCVVTLVFTVLGDLFESMMKRQAGVKDSGSILPGHGGVLDRIDSITAAAPVFVAGLLFIEQL